MRTACLHSKAMCQCEPDKTQHSNSSVEQSPCLGWPTYLKHFCVLFFTIQFDVVPTALVNLSRLSATFAAEWRKHRCWTSDCARPHSKGQGETRPPDTAFILLSIMPAGNLCNVRKTTTYTLPLLNDKLLAYTLQQPACRTSFKSSAFKVTPNHMLTSWTGERRKMSVTSKTNPSSFQGSDLSNGVWDH